MSKTGYLIFTTHDGDELDANLVEDKEAFDDICNSDTDDEIATKWCEYQNTHPKMRSWRTQTRCPNEQWPFNDVKILGVFYLLVY